MSGLLSDASGKESPANAEDMRDAGSVPGWGRSPGRGHGNPLQYFCLENSLDRGAWWVTVHGVAKSWTLVKCLSTQRKLRIKEAPEGRDICILLADSHCPIAESDTTLYSSYTPI